MRRLVLIAALSLGACLNLDPKQYFWGGKDAGVDAGPSELGTECGSDEACKSGHCSQGFCCESACDTTCRACNVRGFEGRCVLQEPGTVCAEANCKGSTRTLAGRCDVSGKCAPGPSLSCAPFVCGEGGECKNSCSGNQDCVGAPCAGGSCGKMPDGNHCDGGSDCNSGNCQQGICCRESCEGNCRSCSVSMSEGICLNVPAGQDPLEQCSDDGVVTCQHDGLCDGLGGCRKYAMNTVCVAASCEGSSLNTARTCDGAGTCRAAASSSCGTYLCDSSENVCRVTCSGPQDCSPGHICSNGACIPGKRPGDACSDDAECGANRCVGNVCCSTLSTVDLAAASVSGTVTLAGAALPQSSDTNHSVSILLRGKADGAWHQLHIITYMGSAAPYQRAQGSETFRDIKLVAGEYDVFYDRTGKAAEPVVDVRANATSRPLVARALLKTVSIARGTSTLDLDIPVAKLSGRLTLKGEKLPENSKVNTDISIALRRKGDGTMHTLHVVPFQRTGGGGPFMRNKDADRFSDVQMVPGTYELVYDRSGAGMLFRPVVNLNSDPIPLGRQVLKEIVIGPGEAMINIDIPVAQLSGTLTLQGNAFPTTSTARRLVTVFLRDKTSGSAQRLTTALFTKDGTSFNRPDGSDSFSDLKALPGAYELIFQSGEESLLDAATVINAHDPIPMGRAVMREVAIVPGPQTVNVDVPVAVISGTVTLAGAVFPSTSVRNEPVHLMLRDRRDGSVQVFHRVYYNLGTGPFSRADKGDTLTQIRVLPGSYELIYQRGSTELIGPIVSQLQPTDTVPFGRVALSEVTVAAGESTFNVDVPVVSLSGTLNLGGQPLPMTSTAVEGITIYLRSARDGSLQELHRIFFASNGANGFVRAAGSESWPAMKVLGSTYEVIYQRGGQPGLVPGPFLLLGDAIPMGRASLGEFNLNALDGPLNLDIPNGTASGTVTFNNSALPMQATLIEGLVFYLTSRTTRAVMPMHKVTFTGQSPYSRTPGSEMFGPLKAPAGIYQLSYHRSQGEVGGTSLVQLYSFDEIPFGRAVLSQCIEVK